MCIALTCSKACGPGLYSRTAMWWTLCKVQAGQGGISVSPPSWRMFSHPILMLPLSAGSSQVFRTANSKNREESQGDLVRRGKNTWSYYAKCLFLSGNILRFYDWDFQRHIQKLLSPLKFSVSWLCNLLEEPWGAQVMLWLFLALFSITWQSELSSFVDGR